MEQYSTANNNQQQLHLLAQAFAAAETKETTRRIIADALQNSGVDVFVKNNSCGWNGVDGSFARHLSKILQAIDLSKL